MVLVNCNIFLWISAFCNNKSGGPQVVSSTRTSLWSHNCLGLINEGSGGKGAPRPPRCVFPGQRLGVQGLSSG